MFGETTLALRAWMREHGVAQDVATRVFSDKTLAFMVDEDKTVDMLALMSHLCRTQPKSLDDYLCGHLLTWAPHYLEELAVAARHPFYRGLAELARSTLLGIQDFRGLSVKLPCFYK